MSQEETDLDKEKEMEAWTASVAAALGVPKRLLEMYCVTALAQDLHGHVDGFVYVVTAIQEDDVVEQAVFSGLSNANQEYRRLEQIYGASHVFLSSREVQWRKAT